MGLPAAADTGELVTLHAEARQALDAVQADLVAEQQVLAELRTQFSTELERARAQVTVAQERAEASERRSLRELLAAVSEACDAAVAQAEVWARLEAQAATLASLPAKSRKRSGQ